MKLQIMCEIHNDEEIVLLDTNKQPERQNRCYCLECINNVKLQSPLQIKKVPQQANEFCKRITEEINLDYNPFTNKIAETIYQLNTLKKKIITQFDEIIKKCENIQNILIKNKEQEQQTYQYIVQDITRTKLEQIGEMLSGNHQRISKINDNKETLINFNEEFQTIFNQIKSDQKQGKEEVRSILIDQIVKQSSMYFAYGCYSLVTSQEDNLIVGGKSKDIVIWQQNQFQLAEKNVLQGHQDVVTALIIYKSGDIIVSGSQQNDLTIKLWKKQNNQWNCQQSIQVGILEELKLTTDEEQLISVSDAKIIKIWKLKLPDIKLECIQTINESIFVYWITLSQDSKIMALSNWNQQFIQLYKCEECNINPWKKINSISTNGCVKRVFFTNTNELLAQLVNSSQLVIYQENQYQQFTQKQKIILDEEDNSDIFFPIFQSRQDFYLKNQKNVYIIGKMRTGRYFIKQIIPGNYRSGNYCSNENGIVLWNYDNYQIEIYK